MDTLLPDFSQATFNSEQPVDNQYFPLTPGTVLSYQGELYDTEEIVGEVAEEIGEEIAEEIVEGFGVAGSRYDSRKRRSQFENHTSIQQCLQCQCSKFG